MAKKIIQQRKLMRRISDLNNLVEGLNSKENPLGFLSGSDIGRIEVALMVSVAEATNELAKSFSDEDTEEELEVSGYIQDVFSRAEFALSDEIDEDAVRMGFVNRVDEVNRIVRKNGQADPGDEQEETGPQPVVVLKTEEDVKRYGKRFPGARVVSASIKDSFRGWISDEVYVDEDAISEEIASLIRNRQLSFKYPRLAVLSLRDIVETFKG